MQKDLAVLVAEFHAQLPRERAKETGAAYARYTTPKQASIVDQIRTILTAAITKGIFIPLENIFFDLAEKGQKTKRPGLMAFQEALRQKKVQVALFFATNRFFRKTYHSLRFVDEEIVERGIRVIFVTQGIDSANTEQWRLLHQFHSIIDEYSGSMYGVNISAALIGLAKEGLVCGVVPFGFKGEPIPTRKTRRGTIAHLLVKCEVASRYVELIYRWYVNDNVSIDEIARRLNDDPNCPPPPKSSIHGWRHGSVVTVLIHTINRGLRQISITKSVWSSSKEYSRKVKREAPQAEQYEERYRIISDELFQAAQAKLAADRHAFSCNYLRTEQPKPLTVMNGLFICGVHQQRIYFSGTRGRYGLCPCCRAESENKRALYSHLPRERAIRKICQALQQRILNDSTLIERVITRCDQAIEKQQRPDPSIEAGLTKKVEKLRSTIDFILRNPGETDQDQQDAEKHLRQLRQEKSELEWQLAQMKLAAGSRLTPPDREELQAMISQLSAVLMTDAICDMEQARRLRQILELLTGGKIEVHQKGEAASHRGWLQGSFRLHVMRGLSHYGAALPQEEAGLGELITVDFDRDPKEKTTLRPEFISEVKRLYELNMPIKSIQRQLGCGYAKVVAARKMNTESVTNLPHPNSRRSATNYQFEKPPLYRLMADKVKALDDQGKLIQEIAAELDMDRNTAAASLRYSYESRGLKAPDGRTRRKQLKRNAKQGNMLEQPNPLSGRIMRSGESN